jgi:hypothetical protein
MLKDIPAIDEAVIEEYNHHHILLDDVLQREWVVATFPTWFDFYQRTAELIGKYPIVAQRGFGVLPDAQGCWCPNDIPFDEAEEFFLDLFTRRLPKPVGRKYLNRID